MRKILLLLAICALTSPCNYTHASDRPGYAAHYIPDSLKKGANAVIREAHAEVTVLSPTEVQIVERLAITVLNKEGAKQAAIQQEYDKLTTVEEISGQQYDKDGKLLGTIQKRDIVDMGYHDNATFYDDARFKQFEFAQKDFPYTVYYELKITRNTTFNFYAWQPQEGNDCAIEKSDIIVKYKSGAGVICYQQNCDKPVANGTLDSFKTISFSVNNLHARYEHDAFTTVAKRNGPIISFGAGSASMQGFYGKTGTWADFGSYIYKVNSNLDTLQPTAKAEIHHLTDTCTTVKSKVAILYRNMQHNTRYLQIYLGIGGWQAHPACNVAQKGYGDCKDLSNYMNACLKEAGITSYRTLIFAGKYPFLAKLPPVPVANCFNHMILCVPDGKDTIWLECTSSAHPAGYLGDFTTDREGLMLTPDGGILVHTPRYTENVNRLTRTANMSIDNQNLLHGQIHCHHGGEFWFYEQQHDKTSPETESHFNKMFAIPTYKTDSYSVLNMVQDGIPATEERVTITGNGKISRSAGRIFFTPKIFKDIMPKVSVKKRTDSFQIYRSMSVADTANYLFTGNNTVEQLPQDIKYDLPFASYHSHVSFEQGNLLKIVTEYKQSAGVYPPGMYDDFAKMAKDINNDRAYGEVVLAAKP